MAERVQPLKPLLAVHPNDTLAAVVRTLFEQGCSMAPVLANSAKGKLGCAARRLVLGAWGWRGTPCKEGTAMLVLGAGWRQRPAIACQTVAACMPALVPDMLLRLLPPCRPPRRPHLAALSPHNRRLAALPCRRGGRGRVRRHDSPEHLSVAAIPMTL